MNWNYVGIDEDPPRGPLLIILTTGGVPQIGNKNHPQIMAWTTLPKRDQFKEQCQNILRGLPELGMVSGIIKNEDLFAELAIALAKYDDASLAEFVQLVRALDQQLHRKGRHGH